MTATNAGDATPDEEEHRAFTQAFDEFVNQPERKSRGRPRTAVALELWVYYAVEAARKRGRSKSLIDRIGVSFLGRQVSQMPVEGAFKHVAELLRRHGHGSLPPIGRVKAVTPEQIATLYYQARKRFKRHAKFSK